MDEIVKEFLVENYENLDRLDSDLVKLEKDPHSKDTLGSIFRTIHTLKGTSGFLGFGKLEAVAHVGENLLSKLRDGIFTINPEITSALLATVDAVRAMLAQIEETGDPGSGDYSALIERLTLLNEGKSAPAAQAAVPVASVPAPAPEPVAPQQVAAAIAEIPKAVAAAAPAPQPAPVAPVVPVAPPVRAVEIPAPPAPAAPAPEHGPAAAESEHRNSAVSDSTIRVDVGLLDKLMNLVGELVLARNQILQFTGQYADTAFTATSQRLNLITTELQGSVMKTRMQPIGNVWNKLPRVVRDLATACGKEVRIEMIGQETELDKTIIEAIKDPLTHIVRNSVDHGIESPEQRVANGKPAEGCLTMRAYHEGGQVNIEITDDGGGISGERVRQKALQRGLITPEQAARMSEHEMLHLIFLPGFSTAEKITNVSGRGVGMDVVKTNIEKIGGMVDLQSQAGTGTTLKIKIPLTLAIIPALIVTSGGDRFAIPQVSLLELVRLEADDARTQIEFIHGVPVYRLRGRLLPLVYLNRELKLGETSRGATQAARARSSEVFVIAREKHREWVGRLRLALEDKLDVSPEQAGAFHDCSLGKWIYSEGLRDYADLRSLHALVEAHQNFHVLAKKVVELKRLGRLSQAQEALAEVTTASETVIRLLVAVEKSVLEEQAVNIVVLQADGHPFGLVVDEINDTEEIVVKPLGKQLKGVACFAGATIMGDGRVALILDVLGIAQRANVVAEGRDRAHSESSAHGRKAADPRQTLLLFDASEGSRMAIPLSVVARLEEFPLSSIERSGAQEVVRYRGQIMPLIRVSKFVPGSDSAAKGDGPMQVVVYSEQGRSVGLVVGRINDIVQETITVKRHAHGNGIFGSVVIQDRVTDLLDVKAVIRAADPTFYPEKPAAQAAA